MKSARIWIIFRVFIIEKKDYYEDSAFEWGFKRHKKIARLYLILIFFCSASIIFVIYISAEALKKKLSIKNRNLNKYRKKRVTYYDDVSRTDIVFLMDQGMSSGWSLLNPT
jgi:hypothetical protein